MSGYTIQGGAILPATIKLTTTNPTVIVDGADTGAIVVWLSAVQIAGTPDLTLETYDGTTSTYLRLEQPFPTSGDSIGEYTRDVIIRLKSGQSLRATASVADQIDIHASYISMDSTGRA